MLTKGLGVTVAENKSSKPSNKNGLYSMRSTAAAKELHQRYKDILEPLSLFTPRSIEDGEFPVLQLERPVTPIDKSVKLAPTSLADLCQMIQRRIAAKSEVTTVSIETQQALGGMIIADVKLHWEDIELCPYDITLTNMENKELSRRIITHIITVCEQLFLHYLHMVDIVRQRSVFTDDANLSRLKAQLALDCTKFLNISAIKRHIAKDIKALRKSTDNDDEPSDTEILGKHKHMVHKSMSPEAPFTFKHFFNLSRPKKVPKPKPQTIETDLQEINERMPHLDLEQVYNVLPHKVESAGDHRQMQIVAVRTLNLPKQQSEEQISTKYQQPVYQIYQMNWRSHTNLNPLKALPKQLGIFRCNSSSEGTFLRSYHRKTEAKGNEQKLLSIADDLNKLLQTSTVDQGDHPDPEATLPPLIQALTYDKTSEIKKHKREKMLRDIEKEEEREKLKWRLHLQEPEHAQPATVNIKVSKKMIAQTADVRVSDRRFIDSVYLQIYPTVYNHFVGEIDLEMATMLDKNLSFGEELHDIYKELLKDMSKDYLLYDQDPIVTPTAVGVDLSGCFASSTLSRRKNERVINPELEALEFEYVTERYLLMKKELEENYFQPKDQRQKAVSMLESDVNLNDYLKYAFTQESDYLGVVFHFYDSEDEKNEEIKALIARELELKREEDKELEKIRLIKEEFVTGTWNVNTVMFGGLGKDPLPEEDSDADFEGSGYCRRLMSIYQKMIGALGNLPVTLLTMAQSMEKSSSNLCRGFSQSMETIWFNMDRVISSMTTTTAPTMMEPLLTAWKLRLLALRASVDREQAEIQKLLGRAPDIEDIAHLQSRLQRIWTTLHVPDWERLDMAIKYNSNKHRAHVSKVLEAWEKAVQLIKQRECILSKLEDFERFASNPNRFFVKGYWGTSAARLKESKERDKLHSDISQIESTLSKILKKIKNNFEDIVTYKGRPYLEKMQRDKVEMLFWLQQERRKCILQRVSAERPITPKHTSLQSCALADL
ncbi:coiled-coil domain-containing protein 87 [Heptranchias perlo]|uniref:coiled-coil domain-containing protein 87 n=1 Tax=Heptranchias perlo TaxID=212740 RepID=UPI003559E908